MKRPFDPRARWAALALVLALVLLLGAGLLRLRRGQPAPEHPAARHYRAGLELARAGDEQKAVSEWNLAVAMNPADARPYEALAAYWEASGRPDLAAQTMERLAKANPAAPHRDCRFARAAFAAGWVSRATEAVERAVREEPSCPIAHTMHGIILEDARESAAALAALIRAHQLNPDDARVALTLAQLDGRAAPSTVSAPSCRGIPLRRRRTI
jgi:Flp pilus assembly protein TadD